MVPARARTTEPWINQAYDIGKRGTRLNSPKQRSAGHDHVKKKGGSYMRARKKGRPHLTRGGLLLCHPDKLGRVNVKNPADSLVMWASCLPISSAQS